MDELKLARLKKSDREESTRKILGGRVICEDKLGLKIAPAERVEIEKYNDEVEEILKAIGHPEAFVTDESSLEDFFKSNVKQELLKLLFKLGVQIKFDTTFIWEIARELRQLRAKGT